MLFWVAKTFAAPMPVTMPRPVLDNRLPVAGPGSSRQPVCSLVADWEHGGVDGGQATHRTVRQVVRRLKLVVQQLGNIVVKPEDSNRLEKLEF